MSNQTPWNKERAVGQRKAFEPNEVCAIFDYLVHEKRSHELCLFTFGIDAMLRASDLLAIGFDERERTMRVGFEGMSGEDMGAYANFMITLQTLESMGMTDVFGKGGLATDGAADIPIYPATDIAHMRDVTQALVNGFSGDNGEILSQPHIDQMRHAVQWFHPDGDHAKGNYSQAETREHLKGLGIMNPNNTIAWGNWRIAGEFIQTNYGTGVPDYQKLQKHMQKQIGVEREEPGKRVD